ncbi:HDOD domain-containing protein [Thalassotalea euphylliae]|uniref:HDOD domain-containing protein n=1 Tax=Thalassotalea euphylliae TaxID=1655234 RepID=UPI0036252505
MSTDAIALLIVLVVFFFIFRRLNREKPKKLTANASQKSAVSYATRKAIDSQKQRSIDKSAEHDNSRKVPEDFVQFQLFKYADLTADNKQAIHERLQNFSKPHPLLMKLLDGFIEQKELTELIKSDPDIAAKILKVVNSAQFALQQPIKDIHHAIIFLGVTEVRNIALQFAMKQDHQFEHPMQERAYQRVWQSSYLASQLCLLLSKSLGKDNAAELSTLCLLLYLGDLALLKTQPDLAAIYLQPLNFYERLDQVQMTVRTNPAIAGAVLAKEWELPNSMVADISHQFHAFTNELVGSDFPQEQQDDLLLCYIICRLSDMVVFENNQDVLSMQTLDYQLGGDLAFYHLKNMVSEQRLSEIEKELSNNSFAIKAKEIVARIKVQG